MNCKLALFFFIILVTAGCVLSLHPLYNEEDTVYEVSLVGQWKTGDDTWTFEENEDAPTYDLNIIVDGKEGRFTARLTKIQDTMFMDLFPEELDINANDYYKFHLLPTHTFWKIEAIDPNLKMRAMNPEYIAELIEKKPDVIKHEILKESGDVLVLTASTKELRKFVADHINEEKLFGDLNEMSRVKPDEPEDANAIEPNKQEIKNS